jgi:hypothetical protein
MDSPRPTHPTDRRLAFETESRSTMPQPRRDERALEYVGALRRQLALLERRRLRFVSIGPPRDGWPRTPGIFYRCLNCGYVMAAESMEYDTCFCGSMHRDVDAGRFGSNLGDRSIETLESM